MIGGDDMKNIGEKIQFLREQRGMTQATLCAKMGLSRVTIGSYEAGRVMPSVNAIIKLSEIFHVSLDWLCGTADYVTDMPMIIQILDAHQGAQNDYTGIYDLHKNLYDEKIKNHISAEMYDKLISLWINDRRTSA